MPNNRIRRDTSVSTLTPTSSLSRTSIGYPLTLICLLDATPDTLRWPECRTTRRGGRGRIPCSCPPLAGMPEVSATIAVTEPVTEFRIDKVLERILIHLFQPAQPSRFLSARIGQHGKDLAEGLALEEAGLSLSRQTEIIASLLIREQPRLCSFGMMPGGDDADIPRCNFDKVCRSVNGLCCECSRSPSL